MMTYNGTGYNMRSGGNPYLYAGLENLYTS
jgi:lysozyme family protein